jgi:hypothetical protein
MNNYQKGRNFELKAKAYFENLYGVKFNSGKILTGLNGGKLRQFDLINEENMFLIETVTSNKQRFNSKLLKRMLLLQKLLPIELMMN